MANSACEKIQDRYRPPRGDYDEYGKPRKSPAEKKKTPADRYWDRVKPAAFRNRRAPASKSCV
jgi:hypothetical protein